MGAVETQRTLVKSVPELWAELSEVTRLRGMLGGQFGEIAITRLTPESRIEWESELAAGSVELKPSGFGTRVRLTAEIAQPTPAPAIIAEEPVRRRGGLLSWLRGRRAAAPEPPASEAPPPPEQTEEEAAAEGALTAVLDQIGAARHRPFSRD
jgi:hypothetical protein